MRNLSKTIVSEKVTLIQKDKIMLNYGWITFGAIVMMIVPILGLLTAVWAASKRAVKDYLRFGAGLLAVTIAFICGYSMWTVGDNICWWVGLPLTIIALASATKIIKIGLREVRYS